MCKPRIFGLIFFLLGCLDLSAQTGFVENRGQFHDSVLFESEFQSFKIFIDQGGFTVLLYDQEHWVELLEQFHGHDRHKHKFNPEPKLAYQAIQYRFKNANWSQPLGMETYDAPLNYILGNDPSKWASHVRKHRKVVFKNVYPHIDIEFEAIDQRFKYNFILHPGAHLEDIQFEIDGANKIDIRQERIRIYTRFGSFDEMMPISYSQTEDGKREQLTFLYHAVGNQIGLSPEYDGQQGEGAVVVDPELIFSTYAGNSVDNFGYTATYDRHGNLYAGGIATSPYSSIPNGRYPVTAGAFDVTFNGGSANAPANLACDITISKYDSTGSTLVFATYLGGTNDEYPHSLVVDKDDQLIILGTTYSNNFPITPSAPQHLNHGLTDLVVTKLNASGAALIGSTYIGGTSYDGLNSSANPSSPGGPPTKYYYADDFRGEVNLDTNGNIYVASTTRSVNFPVTGSAFQATNNGKLEGVVFRLSKDIDQLDWASYYGGSGDDALYSIDYAANGFLYVAGGTNSSDLKGTTGSLGTSFNGGRTDGMIAMIALDGSKIERSAYWGTSGYDQILAAEIDKYGNVFVVGQTDGDLKPQGQVYKNDKSGQFISKFDAGLNNVLLSTLFGSGRGRPDITINAFLVDECDKIFVSGWGGSINYGPTVVMKDMPLTYDAIQKNTDGNDFYIAVFRKNMSDLVFATYFGGDQTHDHVDGGTSRFDKRGVIYQSVCASCPGQGQGGQISDFPTTSGAFAETNSSPRCSNASFKLDFGNLNRKPQLKEEWYTVGATDTLVIRYEIDDPDGDTLVVVVDTTGIDLNQFVHFSGDTSILLPPVNGPTQAALAFEVAPDCSMIGDTITIPVYALDIGCPEAKDSTSLFHIVIEPPPLLPAPEVVCLNFLAKDALRIEWSATPQSRYFKEMLFYKVSPSNDTLLLASYSTQQAGTYVDNDVIAPRKNNYTYFFVVVNICDLEGPKSYDVSSVKEHEIPVAPTYLKTVTVEGQQLRIEWLKSTEVDFGHYEIYKSQRGGTETEYIASLYDIDSLFFFDEDVDVNSTSYCYQIRVSDDCGHLSVKSNRGCSIVIRGESKPFAFDLNWDEYLEWAGGVDDYELMRSVDTGYLLPIVRVDYDQRTYTDDKLDYDWGGYWFSVLAYEGAGSQEATSRSNDIYLVQPPLLHVPNAFTANDDQLNDVFSWSDVFVLEFHLQVYNRWGQMVFETTDKNADWDGLFQDNGYKNSNAFIWVAKYTGWDGSAHYQKGTVTILR